MTEIEMYKKTIQAVHNEYIKELKHLKELLGSAIEDDIVDIKTDGNDKHTIYSVTLSTLDTAMMALRMKTFELLTEIEREENEDIH